MIITANTLKLKGVSLIEKILKKDNEAVISVRGERKFVVMPIERYDKLKEAELLEVIRQAKEDYTNGNVIRMTAKEHIEDLEKCLNS